MLCRMMPPTSPSNLQSLPAALTDRGQPGSSDATAALQVQGGELWAGGRQRHQGGICDVGVPEVQVFKMAGGPVMATTATGEGRQAIIRHGHTQRHIQAGQIGTVVAQSTKGVIADVCITCS